MNIKLYGAPLSPFVRKARFVLAVKQIEHDFDPSIRPKEMPDWYEKIHPLKKVPALTVQDGNEDISIADSSAICGFLEKHQPDPPLYPASPTAYGQALWLEEYADTELAVNATFHFFGHVIFPTLQGQTYDADVVKQDIKELRPTLAYLESQLGDRDWFVGDAFSIADLYIMTQLISLHHAGYTLQKSDGARVYEFIKRMLARPEIATILAEEEEIVAKMGFQKPDLNAL